ncbi:MAG: phosphonate C-P lyase system protein PhnG [Desulfitobacterium sp.]
MKRKRRTEILLNSPRQLAEGLAQEILSSYSVNTIEDPNSGLVMVKVRETAKRELFFLGEVLITECKVMISGCLGIGMTQGQDAELAYYLGIIDAAYNLGLPETEAWAEPLLAAESALQEKRQTHHAKILKTKVNFETMQL